MDDDDHKHLFEKSKETMRTTCDLFRQYVEKINADRYKPEQTAERRAIARDVEKLREKMKRFHADVQEQRRRMDREHRDEVKECSNQLKTVRIEVDQATTENKDLEDRWVWSRHFTFVQKKKKKELSLCPPLAFTLYFKI